MKPIILPNVNRRALSSTDYSAAFRALGLPISGLRPELPTSEAVMAFQKRENLESTGVLDERTVVLFNQRLGEKGLLTYSISGKLLNGQQQPVAGQTVEAYSLNLRAVGHFKLVKSERELTERSGFRKLAQSVTDGHGAYQLTFNYTQFSDPATFPDVVVFAREETTVVGRSRLAIPADYREDTAVENLDVILETTVSRVVPEFQRLLDSTAPILLANQVSWADLDETSDQLSRLAESAGQDVARLSNLLRANKRVQEAGTEEVSAELLFGLSQQGISTDWATLATTNTAELEAALRRSMEGAVITSQPEETLNTSLSRLQDIATDAVLQETRPDEMPLGRRLGLALTSVDQQRAFVRAKREFNGTKEQFWNEYLPTLPELKNQPAAIDGLLLTNELASLTGNFMPLIEALQGRERIQSPKDLIAWTPERWSEVLDTTGLPKGAADQAVYVGRLQRTLSATYPTERIAQLIGNRSIAFADPEVEEGVKSFFSQADGFDIRHSRIDAFEPVLGRIADGKRTEVKQEVQTLQRLFQISPTPEALVSLKSMGLRSAFQITQLPEQTFIDQYAEGLSGTEMAQRVYQLAYHQKAKTEMVAMSVHESLHGIAPQAVLDGFHSTNSAVVEVIKKHIPNYEELFGRIDLCECQDCRSIYSPAAYLVDLLQFLSNTGTNELGQNPRDYLLERRPDLAHLPLTCENTNTLIPYVDLVNEVMEYYVAFGKLEAQAAHDTNDATAAEMRANPQYTQMDAYRRLAEEAVYPFSLPYHQPLDVIRTYTRHLKTDRAEIMEVFHTAGDGITTPAIQAETLQLSEEDYIILTEKGFDGKVREQAVHTYYGYASVLELKAQVVKVPEFLLRTGLTYVEVIELLKTRFLNPPQNQTRTLIDKFGESDRLPVTAYRKLEQIKQRTLDPRSDQEIVRVFGPELSALDDLPVFLGTYFDAIEQVITLYEPESKCDLDNTSLRTLKSVANGSSDSGISNEQFSQIHRFIRLWRRMSRLLPGLTLSELDILVTALGKNTIDPELIADLADVRHLVDAIPLPPVQLASFWGTLDADGPHSSYARLFLNKAIQQIDPIFKPDPLGNILKSRTVLLQDHLPAVLAAFRLTSDEVERIQATTGLNSRTAPTLLTLENLSILYRYALLARALKISVTDCCTLQDLFNLNPFGDSSRSRGPARTRQFVSLVEQVKASGFAVPTLNYLFTGEDDPHRRVGIVAENVYQTFYTLRLALREIEKNYPNQTPDSPELTQEILRSRLALVLPTDSVNQLMGLLNGSVVFSAVTAANLAIDQTAPVLLNGKVRYIAATGRLQVRGVLTDAERHALDELPGVTPGFRQAVKSIYAKPERLLRDHFSGVFAGKLDNLIPALLSRTEQTPLTTAEKITLIYQAFLPFLKDQLQATTVVQFIASLIELDEPTTAVLVEDDLAMLTQSALQEGLSAEYFSDEAFVIPALKKQDRWVQFEREEENTTSIRWEGFITVESPAYYTFIAEVADPDETVRLWVDNQLLFKKPAADERLSWEGMSFLVPGEFYPIKFEYAVIKRRSNIQLFWRTDVMPKTRVPAVAILPMPVIEPFYARMERYRQAALLVNGFKLSPAEITYFSRNKSDFAGFDLVAITPVQWQQLSQYVGIRNEIPQSLGTLLQVFEKAVGDNLSSNSRDKKRKSTSWNRGLSSRVSVPVTAPQFLSSSADTNSLLPLIANATGWDVKILKPLVEKLKLTVKDFRNESGLVRLQNAFALSRKTGIPALTLQTWAKGAMFDQLSNTAQSVKNGVKSRYEDTEWPTVGGKLSDIIRENQKQALISYLLTLPQLRSWGIRDADGLFEYFLIDVQMDACMDTSRIKQAISSVQLFVARILLNLEGQTSRKDGLDDPGIKPGIINIDRWNWMKNYRVWEASRKVFTYPENWLEPEFRTDKTDFFKELESELLQNDITDSTTETALRGYVAKLAEVAKLRISGVFHDISTEKPSKQTVHVVARNHANPPAYYYRTCDEYQHWSGWSQITVDIKGVQNALSIGGNAIFELGDHVAPVVWKNRLFLFWYEFQETSLTPNRPSTIAYYADQPVDSQKPSVYWEIRLAWSEMKDGKWTPKTVSKEYLMTSALMNLNYPPGIFSISPLIDKHNRLIFRTSGYFSAGRPNTFIMYDVSSKLSIVTDQSGSSAVAMDSYISNYMAHERDGSPLLLNDSSYLNEPGSHSVQFSNQIPIFNPWLYPFFFWNQGNSDVLESKTFFARIEPQLVEKKTKPAPLSDYFDVTAKLATSVTATIELPDLKAEPALPSIEPINTVASRDRLRNTAAFRTVSYVAGGFSAERTPVPMMFKTSSTHSGTSSPEKTIVEEWKLAFYPFYHPHAEVFESRLNEGIPVLMKADLDLPDDQGNFFTSNFKPVAGKVHSSAELIPRENIDFSPNGAYSLYNYELFFHIPLFIATRLSKNGKYAEAMQWFHYIFDPTTNENPDEGSSNPNARYWKVLPFKTINSTESIEALFLRVGQEQDSTKIEEWRDNPFDPHSVARSRPVAYMKNVVVKYIENLIAWGDELFRRDTIESINEATQLYIIASHILGPRPQFVPKRGTIKPETYHTLRPKLDGFSNALVELENLVPFSSQVQQINTANPGSLLGMGSALYFCIPGNDRMLKYWDTVADRLFKIRHCMNIAGVERSLALFEPPIDPGLLVQATAQGLSIGSILNDLNTPAPFYRFTYLVQRATEFCSEVKALGSAMLATIEKRDAEELTRKRASHEKQLLQLVRRIKEHQLVEARAQLQATEKSRETAKKRLEYYTGLLGIDEFSIPDTPALSGLINETMQLPADTAISEIPVDVDVSLSGSDERGVKLIPKEKEELDKSEESIWWQSSATAAEALAGGFYLFPQLSVDGKPLGVGAGTWWGGQNLGAAASALAKIPQIIGSVISYQATKAAKLGSYIRRDQEWTQQANQAGREIIQLDKQITAARIRVEITGKELESHDKQAAIAEEIELFLKAKYTNQELYQWMKEQLFAVYKQSFQLAYDLAKKAEKAYQFELGRTDTNFIQYNYWDGSHDGLNAGEHLQLAIRQMEKSYLEENKRDYELTKHISLVQLDPSALLTLKQTGSCVVELPEELFDLDYPGHYFRRIKTVSLTIPCVAGPYTTINCTLRLLRNSVRINTLNGDNGYARNQEEGVLLDDDRFVELSTPFKAVAMSSAQLDSGVFELNFRDERYLPFEGSGAISQWKVELNGKQDIENEIVDLSQFDYETISDVILHLRYTAREDAGLFRKNVVKHVNDVLQTVSQQMPLSRLFSMRHEFSTQWYRFLNPPDEQPQRLTIDLQNRFPYLTNGKAINIYKIRLIATNAKISINEVKLSVDADEYTLNVNPGLFKGWSVGTLDLSGTMIAPGVWSLVFDPLMGPPIKLGDVDDLMVHVEYSLGLKTG